VSHRDGEIDVLDEAKILHQVKRLIRSDLAGAREALGELLHPIIEDAARRRAMAADPSEKTISRKQAQTAINFFNHGVISAQQGMLDEAIGYYKRAIALKPDFVEAHNNLGDVLNSKRRLDEALICFLKAILLNPRSVHAYNNLGNILTKIGCLQEALASFEQALTIDPDCADAHNNRGLALQHLKHYDEALISYNKAVLINRNCASAYINKASFKLLLGKYEEGWPLYEWRWKGEQLKHYARNFYQPLWLGKQSIVNKTILLHGEQGLGDVIQFVRYAPLVEELGAKVILECPHILIPLLDTLKGDITLVAHGDVLPAFDLHCPLMSLPLAFGTRIDSIPASIPYLSADSHKQREWRGRLGPKARPRLGLVWSGNINHVQDYNRSISLRTLEPLLHLDFEFHSLQKDSRDDDHAILIEHGQIQVHEAELHDFSDTAALIAELDLIVTVDTAVAHLAGALGKEVWILLPYSPDFRWMTERSDSPWYPTARLFRQRNGGNWEYVIKDVCSALRARYQPIKPNSRYTPPSISATK
jgi:Flp pilus assembly protein TadD